MVRDVGPVAQPAYEPTTAGLRSALAGLAETRSLDLGTLVTAAREKRLREALAGAYQPPPDPDVIDVHQIARSRRAWIDAYRV
jgi:hypothetical protein